MGVNACTGDGATWIDRLGAGTPWTTPGADVSRKVLSSVEKVAGDGPTWDTFTITRLVRNWVSGRKANYGVLLRLRDESFSACTTVTNCNYWAYASDDWAVASLRPKLTVKYDIP